MTDLNMTEHPETEFPIGEDEHAGRCRDHGFPWCDVCKRPAVWSECGGWLHSTAESPFGVPARRDDSGHEVVAREWHGHRDAIDATRR